MALEVRAILLRRHLSRPGSPQPETLIGSGGPAWLERPALTRVAVTSSDVARAFAGYNAGRPWREQIKPFNFILHANIAPFGYPAAADPTRFRLIAPFETDPRLWLELPWINLHTGEQHEVTIDPNDHRSDVVRLKRYRDVLALYQHHPEPKSLAPDGNPCTRRSPPGLLVRRPVSVLTRNLIGKESNRLEESVAGLIGNLDDALTTYASPTENAWTDLVLPALDDFPNRELAAATGLDVGTVQRIKRRAIDRPHERNRAVLTIVTAELAASKLEGWGTPLPVEALERLASYLDHRGGRTATTLCVACGGELVGRQLSYCSERCRKRAYRARREAAHENSPIPQSVKPALSTVSGIFPPAPS